MIIKYQEGDEVFITSTNHINHYHLAQEITIDDPLVTIRSLIEIWEQDLEGANYHAMMDIPETFAILLDKHGVGPETIKKCLWDIIESGGWIS